MVAHFRGDVHPLSGPAQELTFSCLCSTMSKVRTHSHLRKQWLIQCFVFRTMYLIQCFNTVFNTACVLFLLLLHGTILLTGKDDHRLTEALVLCETQSLATVKVTPGSGSIRSRTEDTQGLTFKPCNSFVNSIILL